MLIKMGQKNIILAFYLLWYIFNT